MRRTAEDAEKTRLALLEAALMSFEEKGWRGATFEHIAERAGVTRGALNHHFRSKTELLSAALEWGWSSYGNRLFTADTADTVVDPAGWLTSLLVEYTTLLQDDPLFRALASTTVLVAPQVSGTSPDKTAALDGWRTRIADALAAVESIRPTPALSAETSAGMVLTFLQGLTVTAVTRPHDLPQPDDLGTAMSALVRGLLTM
ncbi:TetR/AcrR family transcriptional regulator [Corynebacterium kalidii]|uniref:TetR/AcrR family transcriptional regulator n=1 Tax=Corynebacterium kalidii TaxID=2931982 RepID=A0A9X2AYW5_9CORY|nr:TetR/AcrR family transcriptional regulator [Corynebacterium kalidii]MCJ7858178.1 TetR/AcrR family transcriptional regulator [Corynebacterium kalidii]